nr:NBS-containing resistance-like protein [Tanacetum cinerariifolium]
MTSFGYRLNPRYAIKQCSSCGTLYTRDCSCSKENVEDKILVPKPPKNCARDLLEDGEACQRCTFKRCGSGLSKGLCLICENNQNSPNDSPSIFANSSHNPQHIDERCFECGDALDGIFCQQCAYEVIKSSVEDLVSIPSEFKGIPDTMCDVHLVNNPTPLEAKDHFEIVINFNDDYSSSNNDYLYNENIKYVEASPHDSELVSLEVEKIVISEDEEIKDDNLREKLLKVNLLTAKNKALKDNPTPSSDFLTKSSSTSPKSFLEETNTFIILCLNLKTSALIWKRLVVAVPQLILIYLFQSMKLSLSMTFPSSDRSDSTHEEFADELTHIISPPKYECFYFGNLPDPDGTLSRNKARLVGNDSMQLEGIDVDETFSPVYAAEILERAHMAKCNPYWAPVKTESKVGDDALDGCPTTKRSTLGYRVFLINNLLSWSSKRQPTFYRSSAKAEYRGVTNAIAKTYLLRNLLCELHTPLSFATLVYCDNFNAKYFSSNSAQHQLTKYIKIVFHFVGGLVAAGQVRVLHVPSHYQCAYIFTKDCLWLCLSARGAGSYGREWGEVVGSSWSGDGVVRIGEKGAVSLAGMVEEQYLFKRREEKMGYCLWVLHS